MSKLNNLKDKIPKISKTKLLKRKKEKWEKELVEIVISNMVLVGVQYFFRVQQSIYGYLRVLHLINKQIEIEK